MTKFGQFVSVYARRGRKNYAGYRKIKLSTLSTELSTVFLSETGFLTGFGPNAVDNFRRFSVYPHPNRPLFPPLSTSFSRFFSRAFVAISLYFFIFPLFFIHFSFFPGIKKRRSSVGAVEETRRKQRGKKRPGMTRSGKLWYNVCNSSAAAERMGRKARRCP